MSKLGSYRHCDLITKVLDAGQAVIATKYDHKEECIIITELWYKNYYCTLLSNKCVQLVLS